ncbi:MAG: DUF2911 domain-containing protein [Edaphobacter sp.]|uniref:DUF2911 domain-containing protein n=1 Tax=Edaphobacter sp. TaxID=1934404 RepID=UPI002387202A|nr:DUF2911 domain-containing protein [Edaphobacter sp.]MDE1175932.1 DUF2911 domain-containing protein [Edaphobacter sp.]
MLRTVASFACSLLLATTAIAQQGGAIPSPRETANVDLGSGAIKISYGAPSARGRKVMGQLVPFDKVWRTGANEATAFATNTSLKIGDTSVPAGTYTLYTMPSAGQWLLIVSKQTGQWGTVYNQSQDFARIPMKSAALPAPQEKMSISFEKTSGNSTELHVKWENVDESVAITAQ